MWAEVIEFARSCNSMYNVLELKFEIFARSSADDWWLLVKSSLIEPSSHETRDLSKIPPIDGVRVWRVFSIHRKMQIRAVLAMIRR